MKNFINRALVAKKHFKLFFALFAMLALGVGNAWAQTVTWEKATSIAAGDVVALVCETKKMELNGISTTSTKYGIGTAYTSTPAGLYELTIEEGSSTGTFSFKNGTTYLYWTSGNSLATNATKSANTSWTVTISNGNATISNAKDNSRKLVWNASSPRFACYTSNQTAVQLYKKVISEESEDVIVKTLESIAVSGMTTDYETGDVFKFDGTCTATYSVTKNDEPQDDETAVVTPTTVSTPDMSTAGTKEITVTYTEDDVTVTDTYEINVTANEVTPGTYTGNLNNVFFGCATGNNATEQSGKFDDVLVVAGCKSSASSKTNYQSGHVRFYADSYLTLSVPTGYVIKSIVFTADGTWNGSITASAGTYTDGTKTWAGNAQEVKFSFAAQNRIKSVKVTYDVDVKYALNITTPSNGTLVVKDGSAVLADGAQVYEGTKLVVTPTPNAGYVFESLTVGGEAVELTEGSYTFNMPAADVTISATFKENEKPAATLTLSKNGVEETFPGSWKQDDVVTLPSITSDCVKEFVGWSANASCATEPEYKAGDEYTLASTTQTLYAVYADGESGEASLTKMTSSDALANGDKIVIVANGTKLGMYQETISTSYVKNWELGAEEPTISELDEKKIWDVVAVDGSWKLGDATNGYLYNSSSNNLAVSTTGASTWTIAWKTTGFTFKSDQDRYLACRTDLTTDKKNLYRMNGTSVSSTNGSAYEMDIYKYSVSAPSYSNYSTTCAAAPIATIDPTSVTATAAGAEGKVTVTYENVNTENVAVALFNDEACTEAFTADWLTASLDGDKNITYTVAATTLYTERKAYIKLTAPETTGATDPDVVVIPVTQAAKEKVFASLEALLAAITPTTEGVEVTVTLTNEVIQDFYTSGSYRNGIALNVPYQDGVKVIEIYCKDVPAEWVKGGKVSGTITCPWKLYNSTWELCPTAWNELTYTAPATVKSIAVSGTPTKTTYVDGEAFDPTGLVVTATLTDDSKEPIEFALVDWTFDPETLSKGETSVSVVATYNTMASAAYVVTGLTVNDIPTKTVAEFIAAGGTRCYLEGIVSNISNTTYGNFDLTDASGTIFVYGCLNGAGESQKFAELGVKNGDKIKVIADDYELYGGTKDEAKNVQYVSHISAASITISNITMEVDEVATITATVEPAGAAVTYTIKENTANAISLSGNTITALAEGTATITATVAEGATYLGNSVDFTVTVGPKTEKVVILAELGGKWYAMKGAVPSGKSNQLDAIEVTYFNGTLYNVPDEVKESITWTRSVVDGKATFVNNGKYLKGGTSTNLTLVANVDDACKWMWNEEDGYYTTNTSGTIRTFLYRVGYNFKNYGASQAGQEDVNGNYSELPVVTAPVYATGNPVYTRTVTNGNYGTICLPFGSTNYTGATFYEFVGSETGKVYLGSVTTLEAGVPYIFTASAAEVAVYGDGTTAATPGNSNGLHGTFTDETTVDEGNYILLNNELRPSDGSAKVNANRAYIVMSEVPTGVPTQMPGRRYIGMSVQGENEATGFENIVAPEGQAVKAIVNGQLIIIRDGVKYNVQGQKL